MIVVNVGCYCKLRIDVLEFLAETARGWTVSRARGYASSMEGSKMLYYLSPILLYSAFTFLVLHYSTKTICRDEKPKNFPGINEN